MNDITRSDFGGNNGWTACEFVYSLLNGGEYRLRYWKRGGERVVACVDLRESLGEPKQTFSDNFKSENPDLENRPAIIFILQFCKMDFSDNFQLSKIR